MKDLIAFEWRYHTRQISFAAACILFFIFGLVLAATGFGPANVHINSPFSIVQSLGVMSLMSVFILAIFCASAIVRDREYRLEEIIFSTGIEKREFLVSRFTGALLASITAFSLSVPGMVVGRLLPGHDPIRLGPLEAGSYLWALLVMALPNVSFASVILFAVAATTRSLLACAVGAVVIYVLYFAAAAWSNSPLMAASVPGIRDGFPFAVLLDPFGLSAFFEQTRHWTPADRNSRLTALSGMFLWNRVLWLGVSAMGWVLVYRMFGFRAVRRPGPAKVLEAAAAPVPIRHGYRRVATCSSFRSDLSGFFSALRLEVRTSLLSLPFLALTLLWAALAASEITSSLTNNEYGSDLYATSGLVLAALQPSLQLIGLIVVIYYSAEIVWRERALRMDGILNATPASSAIFVLSKWATLSALIGVLILTAGVVTVVFQLVQRYTDVDWSVMAAYSWFAGGPLIVFAMAAVLIHTVIPHKYLGLLLVLCLGILRGGQFTGLEHHLWRFGSTPEVMYSAFYQFGGYTEPFNWYMLHWSLVGVLFLALATRFWRGTLPLRRDPAERRWTPSKGIAAASLLIAVAASTAHILYNTNVRNSYVNSARLTDWKADYERIYGPFAASPQPTIKRVEAAVELFPGERRYRVHGRYLLRNDTSGPIETVLVSLRREARDVALSIPNAALAAHDHRFGHYTFTLATPLQSGERTQLQFDATFGDLGFSASGPQTSVVENGSWIPSFRCFPQFGYRQSYELTAPASRRKAGLPVTSPAGEGGGSERNWVELDLTVSTAADQIPVTTGRLDREWVANGRRHRRYLSDGQVPDGFVVASGRYQVLRSSHDGVALELYHHPPHAFNARRMMHASREALRQFEESFGPYPYAQLKIVEAPDPGHAFGGFARTDTVFIGENRGFLTDMRDSASLDIVSRRIAHEVAHQWWGIHLAPAPGPGSTFITESLTKYSELLVLESMYGPDVVRESLTHELDAYLERRTHDEVSEKPLVHVLEEPYLYYRKGAIVTWALRDLLGPERFHDALQSFYESSHGAGQDPDVISLVSTLESVATAEERLLIHEWLQEVILYDLKIDSIGVTPLDAEKYEVVVRISATRTRADGSRAPLDERIPVALYSSDPDLVSGEENLIHFGRYRVQAGENQITMIVDRRPGHAAVDPYITRLDTNRFDNGRNVN